MPRAERSRASASNAPRRKQSRAVESAGTPENRPAQMKLLTVAEVAELMRVSKMTVYRLVHGGGLPAVRIGRSFRVPEQAVNDYLRDAYIEAG